MGALRVGGCTLARMARAYIGTAGFSYPEWRPGFYPTERDEWIARILGLVARGIDAYAFIKHEQNPDAPLIAREWVTALVSA